MSNNRKVTPVVWKHWSIIADKTFQICDQSTFVLVFRAGNSPLPKLRQALQLGLIVMNVLLMPPFIEFQYNSSRRDFQPKYEQLKAVLDQPLLRGDMVTLQTLEQYYNVIPNLNTVKSDTTCSPVVRNDISTLTQSNFCIDWGHCTEKITPETDDFKSHQPFVLQSTTLTQETVLNKNCKRLATSKHKNENLKSATDSTERSSKSVEHTESSIYVTKENFEHLAMVSNYCKNVESFFASSLRIPVFHRIETSHTSHTSTKLLQYADQFVSTVALDNFLLKKIGNACKWPTHCPHGMRIISTQANRLFQNVKDQLISLVEQDEHIENAIKSCSLSVLLRNVQQKVVEVFVTSVRITNEEIEDTLQKLVIRPGSHFWAEQTQLGIRIVGCFGDQIISDAVCDSIKVLPLSSHNTTVKGVQKTVDLPINDFRLIENESVQQTEHLFADFSNLSPLSFDI